MGELDAFASLKVGLAAYVKIEVIAPDSDGKGYGTVTALGKLEAGGDFYMHLHEEFRPAIGEHIYLDLEIKFFPNGN